MKITKALIACAGFGTRFLPITKTIQKEMLPILDRPIIDYVVEDCVKAGIEEIVFVISEHNQQLIHFYRENTRLKNYLDKMGKSDKYALVEHLHSQVKISFVRQSDKSTYGTATPVLAAEDHFKNEEAFLVFMGDDFIYNADGFSEARAMIELYQKSGAQALATCLEKEESVLHKYGIAETRTDGTYTYLTNLVEKPAPGTAPSNLANISKYIFTPAVFDVIKTQQPNPSNGELYITDTITQIAQDNPAVIYTPQGEYLDGGYVAGWLKANLTVAASDPELRAELAVFCESLFGEED